MIPVIEYKAQNDEKLAFDDVQMLTFFLYHNLTITDKQSTIQKGEDRNMKNTALITGAYGGLGTCLADMPLTYQERMQHRSCMIHVKKKHGALIF